MNITLSIQAVPSGCLWGRPKRFPNILLADHRIRLYDEDRLIEIVEGNGPHEYVTVRWPASYSIHTLADFLKKYRTSPSYCKPEADVRSALREFLFASRQLDSILTSRLSDGGSLFIQMAWNSPLAVELPWELADGLPGTSNRGQRALLGTLAALPVARVVKGKVSYLQGSHKERLRVLYVISESPKGSLDASEFHRILEEVLSDREALLSYRAVIAPHYQPQFADLAGEISAFNPHLVIVVCHGRNHEGEAQLRFEQWSPIRELGECLAQRGNALAVVLIACDQAVPGPMNSAQTGAMELIGHGVPAVIAMQSKVHVDAARYFLQSLMSSILRPGDLAHFVARARIEMARGQNPTDFCDWSFPALFLAEDAPRRLRDIGEHIDQFEPILRALWRGVPPERSSSNPTVKPFLRQNELLASITEYFEFKAGLLVCWGQEDMERPR